MGDVIDLDAIRGEVEPRHIKLGGREWELPPELPAVFLEHLYDGRVTACASVLVGVEEADEFAGLLDATVLNMIVDKVYGLRPEEGASGASSSSTGKPRRPTSKRTTA